MSGVTVQNQQWPVTNSTLKFFENFWPTKLYCRRIISNKPFWTPNNTNSYVDNQWNSNNLFQKINYSSINETIDLSETKDYFHQHPKNKVTKLKMLTTPQIFVNSMNKNMNLMKIIIPKNFNWSLKSIE